MNNVGKCLSMAALLALMAQCQTKLPLQAHNATWQPVIRIAQSYGTSGSTSTNNSGTAGGSTSSFQMSGSDSGTGLPGQAAQAPSPNTQPPISASQHSQYKTLLDGMTVVGLLSDYALIAMPDNPKRAICVRQGEMINDLFLTSIEGDRLVFKADAHHTYEKLFDPESLMTNVPGLIGDYCWYVNLLSDIKSRAIHNGWQYQTVFNDRACQQVFGFNYATSDKFVPISGTAQFTLSRDGEVLEIDVPDSTREARLAIDTIERGAPYRPLLPARIDAAQFEITFGQPIITRLVWVDVRPLPPSR